MINEVYMLDSGVEEDAIVIGKPVKFQQGPLVEYVPVISYVCAR